MKVPPPYSHTPAIVLFIVAGLCAVAGMGLAFTIYGELALVFAVLVSVLAALLLGRSGDPSRRMSFQPPPGWPPPPTNWRPTSSWRPDPSWPAAPSGWRYWVPNEPRDDSV